MDGLKTGYIRASGYNLAASAKRHGRRLITIVFGGKTSSSRDAEVARLMDLGFSRVEERRRNHIVLGPPAPKPTSIAVQAIAGLADDRPGAIVSTPRSGPQPTEDGLPVVHACQARRHHAFPPNPVCAWIPVSPSWRRGDHMACRSEPITIPTRRAVLPIMSPRSSLTCCYAAMSTSVLCAAVASPSIVHGSSGFSRSEAQTACKLLRRERVECLVLQVSTLHLAQHG